MHTLERCEISAPFWTLIPTLASERGCVLLDSSLGAPAVGRFSFIGMDPVAVLAARRNDPRSHPFDVDIEVTRYTSATGEMNPLVGTSRQPSTENSRGDVLESLRGLLGEYAVSFEARTEELFPLLGGAIGFFGYEAGSWGGPDEKIKTASDSSIPDVYFALYDQLLCHDHATNETYISTVGRGRNMPGARAAAAQSTESLRERLQNPTIRRKSQPVGVDATPQDSDQYSEPRGCFDAAEYCGAVTRIRDHIEAGDIYQACMTQRFENRLGTGDPWQLYCQLRKTNPAPFACYLQTPTFSIVSASPERYLAVDRQGTAESRPIKGTRPRGETVALDTALRKELSESSKDRAENVMIVDLVRNDFGRVCRFGSIEVSDLMQIETYATVFQMVSTVRGDLQSECDALDLVRATFPGGSMTGAPKIEAMKILDRLEPVRRGVYAGGIGYLDYAGSMDLNMVIRSFIIEDRNVFYHGGGGIVADSIPEAEYQESLDKVVALERALDHLKACPPRHESDPISSGDFRSER
ncbi:MAG: aminodeoxychorismate synthase component I [Pirellulales bacterium]|nr:aminodeoxychorismate synthase component I [Pirellulales bacterium]